MDDDGDDKDDTKRRTRNLCEKKRRDQFNMLVSELGAMISSSNRRMDKSTVLKSTISFLRNHNEVTVRSRVHDVQDDWKPTFLVNEEFTYLTLEAMEAFVLVCYPNGQICYVSESITSLLGHNPRKMLNTNLFDLAYQDDRQNLYQILHSTTTGTESHQLRAPGEEILFQCHLQRGTLDIRHNSNYELIQFKGHFRMNVDQNDDARSGFHVEARSSQIKRELLFVCTGRLSTPHLIRDVSLVDLSRCEFTSRHSLEWKFLFLDHRAPPIIGYLPFEVLGTSGYDYYHFDDVDKLMSCHEALIQKGELTSCYYRFLTKGQEWIWLQTRFYITYHQWNAKPEFIVCTHRVVNCAGIDKETKQEDGEMEHGMDSESNEVMKNTNSDMSSISPSSYMGESSEAYSGSYQSLSRASSVKSASGSTGGNATASGSCTWSRVTPQACFNTESDTTSLSSDSRSSQRHSSREQVHKVVEPILVPQHVIGTQYLHPAPYVAAISVPSVLARPAVPIVVTHDQAQIQEQLQRKHEELQKLIERQQEELRQVKEQLFLARLGILQPIINYHEEIPPTQRVPTQLLYEEMQNRNNMGYQQYPPPDGNNHQHNPQMPR